MKKLSLLVVVVLILTGITSAFAEDITIAGIVFQDDEFMQTLIKGMQDACDDKGAVLVSDNTNNDIAREAELINTYVGQGVSGICIAPLDPTASIATLKTADEAGVPVSTVNMGLEGVDFLVGGYTSDDKVNGATIGAYAAEWIKEKYDRPIKIAILHFDHQLPVQSQDRYNGFLDALTEAGIEFEVVADFGAEKADTALAAANDIITANPDIDIFYGANDGGITGATQAILQSGMAGKMFSFGYDATEVLTGLLLDDNDILQGVVIQDPYKQGYDSASLLIDYINGTVTEKAGNTTVTPGALLVRSEPEAVQEYIDSHYK